MNPDEGFVLESIPFSMDFSRLAKRLRVREGSAVERELREYAAEAQVVARPKALCRLGYIDERDDMGVVVDGVRLSSRVLRVNTDSAHRVFMYVATCGSELDAWGGSTDDVLKQFWLDVVKELAVGVAIKALSTAIEETFKPGKTSSMAPGSLLDWPLSQQRPLFQLLGDTESLVGVELTKSCLMVPNKSVSGIRFATEESFASCQLCPRASCPGRHAAYQAGLYESKYGLPAGDDSPTGS